MTEPTPEQARELARLEARAKRLLSRMSHAELAVALQLLAAERRRAEARAMKPRLPKENG